MTFKNAFEQSCFDVASQALPGAVTVDHNKRIQIESAIYPEVASFKGPPAKEIDMIVVELAPKVVLLTSCKLLTRRAEPAHVQEWGAVVRTMNAYSRGTTYFGVVVSASGFTDGCEAWATSHNVGLIPPLKGRRLDFSQQTVLRMYRRVLVALSKRAKMRSADLPTPPAFFDFVFRLTSDFEGHQEATDGGRYVLMPQGWHSSFGELSQATRGRKVDDLVVLDGATALRLSDETFVRFGPAGVAFGPDGSLVSGATSVGDCRKNFEMEPCSIELVKSATRGGTITSAADFGAYLEFGIDARFNLGLHATGFHIFSTENPIEDHRL